MIVTAIAAKNASKINGSIPSTVVNAAIATGRILLTDESTTAGNGSLPFLS